MHLKPNQKHNYSLHFIRKSIRYFIKLNFPFVLGVAICTAILLGACFIGESIRYSLQHISESRLGRTDVAMKASAHYFSPNLVTKLRVDGLTCTALLRAEASVLRNDTLPSVNAVQVWGVDSTFSDISASDEAFELNNNEAYLNERLANVLKAKVGDKIRIRLSDLSETSSNAPFVSTNHDSPSLRFVVKKIITEAETGNLNLSNNQVAPKNLFVSRKWLSRRLLQKQKANLILCNEGNSNTLRVEKLLQSNWEVEDIGLQLKADTVVHSYTLHSPNVFLPDTIVSHIQNHCLNSTKTLCYFVSEVSCNKRRSPFSFVAGLESGVLPIKENEIVLNRWLANDLSAEVGDSVTLSYYKYSNEQKLEQASAHFCVSKILEMQHALVDSRLRPEIPGLTTANHCAEWKTSVPIDLKQLRKEDEAYWKEYNGAPKAFISYDKAKSSWSTPFGTATQLQVFPSSTTKLPDISDKTENQKASIHFSWLRNLSPQAVGYDISPIREQAIESANGGVDFGHLFLGLSFFVLLSGALLCHLLLQLVFQYRSNEFALFSALGFTTRQIQFRFYKELLILILFGTFVGVGLGYVYNMAVIASINKFWVGIVLTPTMSSNFSFSAVAKGVFLLLLFYTIALVTLQKTHLLSVNRSLRPKTEGRRKKTSQRILLCGTILSVVGILLVVLTLRSNNPVNTSTYFLAGVLLFVAGLLGSKHLFYNLGVTTSFLRNRFHLLQRYSNYRERTLFLLCIFLATGTFLTLATGANRRDMSYDTSNPKSGTGGFSFWVETTLPILQDLNSKEGKEEYNIADSNLSVLACKSTVGDDASCLNLNLIAQPTLLGVNAQQLQRQESFRFVASDSNVNERQPWQSLTKLTKLGYVPAIGDQTSIYWGMGKTMGDTIHYQAENGEKLIVQIVGGIAPSVFQGKLLIDHRFFTASYPSIAGAKLLLVKGEVSKYDLEQAFADKGAELSSTSSRLEQFYKIETTYLSIFLQLGALGLLLGTIGLGILLLRIFNEEKENQTTMKFLGFSKEQRRNQYLQLYGGMSIFAILLGTIPAIVVAIPTILSNQFVPLLLWFVGLPSVLIISSLCWILFAVNHQMKEEIC